MMTLSDANKLQRAQKIVRICARVQPGEKVLVLTDTETIRVGELVAIAALQVSDNTVLAVMTPRRWHGDEPPPHIADAMSKSDVLIMPLKFSLTHSFAVEEARKCGARAISMGDYDEGMLESGGLDADFRGLENTVDRIADILTQGRIVEVTSPAGTKLRMDISGRKGSSEPCLAHRPGSIAAPPIIEANVSPLEGSTEGTLVVDGSVPYPGLGVVHGPIRIVIENGEISDIQGDEQAAILRHALEGMDDPGMYNIAELGIGLNPCSKISGKMMEDEGAYGTCHFGIGDNIAYGGVVKARSHIDVVIRKSTIVVDGRMIQRDGELIEGLQGRGET